MNALETLQALPDRREVKTLVLDIERIRGEFTGRFWSLNDYKRRRISHKDVTEWPRTVCAAWRWYGEKKIHFAAEWQEGGSIEFAAKISTAMRQADIITGHNVGRFDIKHLRSLFRDNGVMQPPKAKVIDTLTIARRELGDESLTLDALCQRYGIPTKDGQYNEAVVLEAIAGNRSAQRAIKQYNMGDVEASTGLYTVMLPLATGHPHVAPVAGMDKTLCPRCGSDNVKRSGTHTPAVLVYARYLCNDCTGWFRTTYEGRGPSVRAL